jgi:hypothetical protein
MGLFGFFKRKPVRPAIELLGPTWLEAFTGKDARNTNRTGVWQAKLITPAGNTKFRIKYYGQLRKNFIVGTETAPSLIYAVDSLTGEEILLFDSCKHGYDAMFCYNNSTSEDRSSWNFYSNDAVFEITIMTTNSIGYDEEYAGLVDDNGLVGLFNGDKMPFEQVKRDAFDYIGITAIDEHGKAIEIVSEELA